MIDLAQQKFGRLVVIKRVGKDNNGNYEWLCQCNCGQKKVIRGSSLRNGNTRSCGCLHKELASKANIKHGYYKTKIYGLWNQMIQRCTNPSDPGYGNYGGRGITVCSRWLKFENFLKDMGKVPEGHQIDRINNDGNYCSTNCRWVTPKQNNRNQRSNHSETFDGKTQCIGAWAEDYNIVYNTLWARLRVYGWSITKALTTPVKKRIV